MFMQVEWIKASALMTFIALSHVYVEITDQNETRCPSIFVISFCSTKPKSLHVGSFF